MRHFLAHARRKACGVAPRTSLVRTARIADLGLIVVTQLHLCGDSMGRPIMTITTLSSLELNQDVTRAKKATKDGPVFITDSHGMTVVTRNVQDFVPTGVDVLNPWMA
jgi:hypothetical protein